MTSTEEDGGPSVTVTPPGSPSPTTKNTQNSGYGRQRSLRIDVLLLDGTLRQVELDYRANGQDCLEKVCRGLGIFEEVDYFGLTYHGAKQEELWVNTRNRLYKQLPSAVTYGASRVHLRVKFYAPPHMLLQEETRHLMFLDVRSRLLDSGHWLLDKDSASTSLLAELAALMAQAEFGDFTGAAAWPPTRYQRYFWRGGGGSDDSVVIASLSAPALASALAAAADCHRRLVGTSPAAAEYRMLQAASTGLEMYGCHYHEVKDCFEARLTVAVGPNAICLCRQDGRQVTERYPYPRVQKVTISDRVLYLSLSQENGSIRELGYRLVTQKAANGLYRCVTETHSFFRCDTVRNDVAAQTSRDVKGALVSLFVERDNFSARDFVFDVQRTAKEVHDDARRRLYKCLSAVAAVESTVRGGMDNDIIVGSNDEKAQSDGESRAQLMDRIRSLEQSRLCQVCMDSPVCVVFLPCSHMLCCRDCSDRVAECPVCRVSIATRLTCFVPWTA